MGKVINLKEVARILGVDKATVSRHRKKLGVGTWLGAAYALTADDLKKLRKSVYQPNKNTLP